MIILTLLVACQAPKLEMVSNDSVKQDTTFLQRNHSYQAYHAVYIDYNPNSPYYKLLSHFSFDTSLYEQMINITLKAKPSIAVKKSSLPSKWKTLNGIFKKDSNFYLYAPSDWGNQSYMQITDSTIIQYEMDGVYPRLITDFNKVSATKYTFKLNYMEDRLKTTHAKLTILDDQKGIVIYTEDAEKDTPQHQIFIANTHIKSLPIVINYCKEQKVREYKGFDTINCEKLLDE